MTSRARLRKRQRGQIAVMALLTLVPALLLFAWMISTSQQSFRKQEMQGAADAGAMAAATTAARGMNTIVRNNKAMADILAVMIAVRALKESAPQMATFATALATAAAAYPATAVFAQQLASEALAYQRLQQNMNSLDRELSDPSAGIGWAAMRALDAANQTVKVALPLAVELAANHYARENGADLTPSAYVLTGAPTALPRVPLGRGGKEFIAAHARECCLAKTDDLLAAAIDYYCLRTRWFACTTRFFGIALANSSEQQIVYGLGGAAQAPSTRVEVTEHDIGSIRDKNGRSLQDRVDEDNASRREQDKPSADMSKLLSNRSYTSGGSMRWPSNPPLPMMLAVEADASGAWEIADVNAPLNVNKVHADLKFLVGARGRPPVQVLGASVFKGSGASTLFAYAQAEVFNPEDWFMFDQHWRARLARATLFETKLEQLAEALGVPGGSAAAQALSAFNLH